jgi:ABC-type transport system involved in multi-copper enzyme maturation permease subunit
VNRALFLHVVTQRALSPARAFLIFSIAVFPALILSFAPQLGVQMLKSGAVFGMILGAGLLGQEMSAGVLQLVFARPVSRSEYILSRWLGVGALATAAVLVQVVLGGAMMAARGVPPSVSALGAVALEQSLAAFGIVSVIALLSSFLPGVGDLLAWFALNVFGGVLQAAGAFMQKPWLMRVSEEWSRFLSPVLGIHEAFGGGVVSWFHLVSYFSTVTLCLALAIVFLNRRELSYATD